MSLCLYFEVFGWYGMGFLFIIVLESVIMIEMIVMMKLNYLSFFFVDMLVIV